MPLSQISSPSSSKAQTQSFQNSIRQPKFGSMLAGLMELESDQMMVEEWRLGGGATDLGGCCKRRVVWLSVVGSKLQAGGRCLWVDDTPVGNGLLTAA
ncbi:hypothetical protein WN943_029470 [Citrus x changshan-huyou]